MMASSSDSESHKQNKQDCSLPSTSQPKPKQVAQRNLQYNRRKWKKLTDTAEKWIEVQGSFVSPFVVMRLNKGVLEWGGPSFMRSFAENTDVISKFKEAALARPVHFGSKKAQVARPRPKAPEVDLFHVDCQSLPVVSLRRLITAICNPKGLSAFWTKVDNKPPWWPAKVPFQSPNWVPGGGSKLRCEQLVCILEAYKSNECKHRERTQEPGSPTARHQRPSPPPPQLSVTDQVLDYFKSGDYRSCLTMLEPLSWGVLVEVCNHLMCYVNAAKSTSGQNFGVADFPPDKVDERRSNLNRTPRGFAALKSTGDGDCLFNSLSILLHGNEESSEFLRLAVTVYGVYHSSHYVSMYLQECGSAQAACAFMHMMCAHPSPGASVADWNAQEIVQYTVCDQAAATAKVKSYSGILQVLFAAGYLGAYVQQHSEDYAPGYDALLSPCACSEIENLPTMHIMWVKASSNGIMNHFVPLVPRRTQSRQSSFKGKKFNLREVTENFCHACFGEENMCQACKNPDTWIACDHCKSWFHCLCVGIALRTAHTIKFVCCSLSCMTSVAKLDGSQVTVGDVNRIRRGEDISGDAIDFFMRHLKSNTSHEDIIVLPYFTGQLLQQNSWLHTLQGTAAVGRMREHLRGVGICSTQLQRTNTILIPLCVLNHWVGIVIQKKGKTLRILDSLHGFLGDDVYKRLHSFIIRYLNLVDECADDEMQQVEQVLVIDVPEVKQQVNTHDCGIFLLANFEAVLNGGVDETDNTCPDGVTMRRILLSLVHRYST